MAQNKDKPIVVSTINVSHGDGQKVAAKPGNVMVTHERTDGKPPFTIKVRTN